LIMVGGKCFRIHEKSFWLDHEDMIA